MAQRSDKKNTPIDRHKVFVRNIRENDVAPLEEKFKKICTKYFFFKNKNNTTKSAICSFKTDQEAADFIQKYHDKKIQTSNIKCEFAFRKKYNDKKLISITYRRHKINHFNSIQLYTNCDVDTIVVLSYLKNLFLLNRRLLVKSLDENDQRIDRDEDHSEEATQDSDGNGDGDGDGDGDKSNQPNHRDDVQVVVEKKLKEFEEIVLNIEKTNRNLDNRTRQKLIAKMSNKNKALSKNCFVYTVEFVNLKLAAQFYTYINRNNFLNYLEDNGKNGGKKDVLFFHELCYFSKNNRRVIVKNIKRTCHVENLQKLFRHIEKDPSIYIPKKNNKKQGYALVTFSSYQKVKKALLLNKSRMCGSTITVEEDRNPQLLKLLGVQETNAREGSHQGGDNRGKDKGADKQVDEDRSDGGTDDGEGSYDGTDDGEGSNDGTDDGEGSNDGTDDGEGSNDGTDDGEGSNDGTDDGERNGKPTHHFTSDVEEGKTLFITNIPMGTNDEEVQNYVAKNISKNYIYIRTCRNSGKKIFAFVKLMHKEDADTFLKKIGEYDEEKEDDEEEDEIQIEEKNENVIDKFYKMKKKKKERMKQILLKDHNSGKNAEILFFKNNYLMIKRAVSKDFIKDKKKIPMQEEKTKKQKNRLHNNIHLVEDNNINNDHLGENIIKRNNDLMGKKKELLKNKNFLINPCRIYVRNYPASLEQNLFRQLITKYFTPLFMEKHNLKKKEAFQRANEIIKKMKIMKDHTEKKEPMQNEEKNKKLKDKKKSSNKNGQNLICFIDINKHEHAKQIIHLLQNRNIYQLLNEIIYKKKFHIIRKNKNIMYVDYCIEDIRMVHIKKLKEEKFLSHIRQKNGAATDSLTKKTIKKKKKKESRGKRQREKRRLLKMQNENTNIAHVIRSTSSIHVQQSNGATGQEKKNAQTNGAQKIGATKKKSKLKEKHPNQGAHSNEASKKKKGAFQSGEKKENTKKKTSKKLIKKAAKKSATKKDKEIVTK
ncbi:hypothetical protein C922_03810 [Plasmodium inui San Antonio 1]|uniref:RRM domain-containing protein n=1 Tax=Plasmodium inui San Antonio 1 TaxID=1237626 RepID=W6ZYA7_9APIC|nr:hypothetical protein C922_03810 [Plasmodium inui San Antonio 1]EUD65827.1 hypothetical protein C922_03810 [Plasmodium inui San Antonio 1]